MKKLWLLTILLSYLAAPSQAAWHACNKGGYFLNQTPEVKSPDKMYKPVRKPVRLYKRLRKTKPKAYEMLRKHSNKYSRVMK